MTDRKTFVNDQLLTSLGQNLRAARRDANLTQEQLAALVGVSRALIASIEAGYVNVSIKRLVGLADALGIDLCGLVSRILD